MCWYQGAHTCMRASYLLVYVNIGNICIVTRGQTEDLKIESVALLHLCQLDGCCIETSYLPGFSFPSFIKIHRLT